MRDLAQDAVAIVGMCGRFPGARSVEQLWRNARSGVESIVPLNERDLDMAAVPMEIRRDPNFVPVAAAIDDVDRFDAAYFGISPREATLTDPQQRIFLECAYGALEDAGYNPFGCDCRVGVFGGVAMNTYLFYYHTDPDISLASARGILTLVGNDKDYVATRVSYLLDLDGPSVSVQTACSTSLVAVHMGCETLLSGQCDLALAGSAAIIFPQRGGYLFQEGGIFSSDGRCRAFDAKANGTVHGNGGAVVALKRLEDALRDNDTVHALIIGSALNNDGSAKAGYTAPSVRGQSSVILEAQQLAGVSADQIGYIETHGTGTALGDVIEFEALTQAFAESGSAPASCALGSIKPNIGHLETASAMPGMFKIAHMLKNRELPPLLHFSSPNPRLAVDGSPFYFPTEVRPWERKAGEPLRAGLSSFGIGGTNAHAVLQEAPDIEALRSRRSWHVMPLSAKSSGALSATLRTVATHLGEGERATGADVAFTLQKGRPTLPYRAAVVASSGASAGRAMARERTQLADRSGVRQVAFVFAGAAARRALPQRAALPREKAFEATFALCQQLFDNNGVNVVLPGDDGAEDATLASELAALLSYEIALASQWRSWGVEPARTLGYGFGEITAATVSEAITLEQAAELVLLYARASEAASSAGTLLAVDAAPDSLALEAPLALAADNARSCVVAGPPQAIAAFAETLSVRGVASRALQAPPLHCSLARAALDSDGLAEALQKLAPSKPRIEWLSTLSGDSVGAKPAGDHFAQLLQSPVRFADAARVALDSSEALALEVSPSSELAALLRSGLDVAPSRALASVTRQRSSSERALMDTLAKLWVAGAIDDLSVVWDDEPRRRVSLPGYAFDRKRFWIGTSRQEESKQGSWQRAIDADQSRLECLLSTDLQRYWKHHVVYEIPLVPAAAYQSMALLAAGEIFGESYSVLRDFVIKEALTLPDWDRRRSVRVQFWREGEGEARFEVQSLGDNLGAAWRTHASGRVGRPRGDDQAASAPRVAIEDVQTRCLEELTRKEYYVGGPSGDAVSILTDFQWIKHIWRRDGEALLRLELPELFASLDDDYALGMGLIDSALQGLYTALPREHWPLVTGETYLPLAVDRISLFSLPKGASWWCHVTPKLDAEGKAGEIVAGDLTLFDNDGEPLAMITGLHLKKAPRGALVRMARRSFDDWLYQPSWVAQPLPEASAQSAGDPRGEAPWVLLADEGGVAERLAQLLNARGSKALVVPRNKLDTAGPRELGRLLSALLGEGPAACRAVVDLSRADEPPRNATAQGPAAQADVGDAAALRYRSLLGVLRALAQRKWSAPPKLWVVTRGATQCGARGVPAAGTLAWGVGRVIALEHPEMWGGLVDLDPDGGSARDAEALLSELTVESGENQIALRDERRLVCRLALRPTRAAPPRAESVIRAERTYLVTGGLGALGLAVARRLAERGATHLVLVGRRGEDSVQDASVLEALRKSGAQVSVVSCDVSSAEQVAQLFARIDAELPPLAGVVHAAGIIRDGVLIQQSDEAFEAVLAPKLHGAWNLHRACQGRELDMFVMFSSSTSLLGWPGQGNYAAANAFLDALAEHRRRSGQPGLTINWGPWGQIGISSNNADAARQRERFGIAAIAPDQALEIFERLVEEDDEQVAVLCVDWNKFVERAPDRTGRTMLRDLVEDQGRPAETEAARGAARAALVDALGAVQSDEERRTLLNDFVTEHVGSLLGIADAAEIDPQRPLMELGLDSLIAVELRNQLAAALTQRDTDPLQGRALPATLIFDYPTVDAIAGYLDGLIAAPSAADEGKSEQLDALLADVEQADSGELEDLVSTILDG